MKKLYILLTLAALFGVFSGFGASDDQSVKPDPENCLYFSADNLLSKYFGLIEPGTSDSQVFKDLKANGLEPNRVGGDIEVRFLPNGSFPGRTLIKKFCALKGAPVVPASASFQLMNFVTSDNMSYDFVFSLKKGKNAL